MVPAQVDDLENFMDTLVAKLAAPQITDAELNELRSSTQVGREAKETSPLRVVDLRFQTFINNAAENAHLERFAHCALYIAAAYRRSAFESSATTGSRPPERIRADTTTSFETLRAHDRDGAAARARIDSVLARLHYPQPTGLG